MKRDCSQFQNDLDVVRQFPFSMKFVATEYEQAKSAVMLNDRKTFVKFVVIRNEKVVPWSLFCLSNVEQLIIKQTPFENGKNFSSDHFENLEGLLKASYLIHWQI